MEFPWVRERDPGGSEHVKGVMDWNEIFQASFRGRLADVNQDYDPARDPDDSMHDELYSGWSSAHDYDPRWDYGDELRPHWQSHPFVQLAQQHMNAAGEQGRVYAADLSRQNAVATYINGTQGEPVVLFDPKAHEALEEPEASEQVGRTMGHELVHADQEREGRDFDEDEAEHW